MTLRLSETVSGNEKIYLGFGAVATIYIFLYLIVSVTYNLASSAVKLWWRREVEDTLTFGCEAILVTFALIILFMSFISFAFLKFPLESTVYLYSLNYLFGAWLFFKLIMPLRQKSLGITALVALGVLLISSLIIYNLGLALVSPQSAIFSGIGGAACLVFLLAPMFYVYDKLKSRKSIKK